MRITLDTSNLQTVCGTLTENGRHLSEFIDELARILSGCFPEQQYTVLPDNVVFNHWPNGKYVFIHSHRGVRMENGRKCHRELAFFCELLHDHWLDRLVEQIDSSAVELKIPMNLDKISESFAD